MNVKNDQSGLGLIATIAIIAILGIGGYALYSTNTQDSAIDISDSERREQQRTDARAASQLQVEAHLTLENVRANLALNTQAGVDAAIQALQELQNSIAEASVDISLEAQAELQDMSTDVEQLQASISASVDDGSASILESIASRIDSIQDSFADFSADLEAEYNNSLMTENEVNEVDDTSSMMGNEIHLNTDLETTTEANILMNAKGTTFEGESTAELMSN